MRPVVVLGAVLQVAQTRVSPSADAYALAEMITGPPRGLSRWIGNGGIRRRTPFHLSWHGTC
jgi:hypothetical protein